MTYSSYLKLQDRPLLTQGTARSIYVHPECDRLLVKVFREDYIARKSGDRAPWYRKYERMRHYVAYSMEMREQIALYAHEGKHPRHLQAIVGLVETDLGLGQVVEACFDELGGYASTLRQLVRSNRFESRHEEALKEFFDWLVHSPLVLCELNLPNLMYCFDAEAGCHFRLIDGYGDPTFFPIKSYVAFLNRRANRRRVQFLERAVAQQRAEYAGRQAA